MTYKVTGEVETVKDRLGRTSSMTYDQLGRLTALIDIADRAHAQSYAQPTAGAWTVLPSAGSASSAVPSTSLTAAPQDGDYQIGLNAFDVEGYPARIALYRDATFELGHAHVRHRGRLDEPLRPGEPRDHVDVVRAAPGTARSMTTSSATTRDVAPRSCADDEHDLDGKAESRVTNHDVELGRDGRVGLWRRHRGAVVACVHARQWRGG